MQLFSPSSAQAGWSQPPGPTSHQASTGNILPSPQPLQAAAQPPAPSHLATLLWDQAQASASLRQTGGQLLCHTAAASLASAQVLRVLPAPSAPSRLPFLAAQQAAGEPAESAAQAGQMLDEVLGLHACSQAGSADGSSAAAAITWTRLQQGAGSRAAAAGPGQRLEARLGRLAAAYPPGFATALRAFVRGDAGAGAAGRQPTGPAQLASSQVPGANAQGMGRETGLKAASSAVSYALLRDCEGACQVEQVQLVLLSDSSSAAMGVLVLGTGLSAAFGATGASAGNKAADLLDRWVLMLIRVLSFVAC